MKWSLKIGEFAGIGVFVHATFLLLVAWVILTHAAAGASVAATMGGLIFVLTIFACVVLHEFGHALTAKRYGIRTRDITLLPIGGLARLERMPDDPRQELWVALAGPAVNVAIAAALFVILLLTSNLAVLRETRLLGATFLAQLMAVNLFLALFNMIPAFPMDGGRVLRALLALRMDHVRATQIAAGLGQALAFVLGFVGLFTNPFLVFIALFVWIGAAQEASLAAMKAALGGIPVGRAMLSEFHTVSPHTTLREVVDLILRGSQQDFPVVDNGTVVGLLTRADLMRGLAAGGQEMTVAETMRRDVQFVDSHDMIEPAFLRLHQGAHHTLPVLHGGRLVGLLTLENLGELMMITAALGERGERLRA